jgi:hypothetical protein
MEAFIAENKERCAALAEESATDYSIFKDAGACIVSAEHGNFDFERTSSALMACESFPDSLTAHGVLGPERKIIGNNIIAPALLTKEALALDATVATELSESFSLQQRTVPSPYLLCKSSDWHLMHGAVDANLVSIADGISCIPAAIVAMQQCTLRFIPQAGDHFPAHPKCPYAVIDMEQEVFEDHVEWDLEAGDIFLATHGTPFQTDGLVKIIGLEAVPVVSETMTTVQVTANKTKFRKCMNTALQTGSIGSIHRKHNWLCETLFTKTEKTFDKEEASTFPLASPDDFPDYKLKSRKAKSAPSTPGTPAVAESHISLRDSYFGQHNDLKARIAKFPPRTWIPSQGDTSDNHRAKVEEAGDAVRLKHLKPYGSALETLTKAVTDTEASLVDYNAARDALEEVETILGQIKEAPTKGTTITLNSCQTALAKYTDKKAAQNICKKRSDIEALLVKCQVLQQKIQETGLKKTVTAPVVALNEANFTGPEISMDEASAFIVNAVSSEADFSAIGTELFDQWSALKTSLFTSATETGSIPMDMFYQFKEHTRVLRLMTSAPKRPVTPPKKKVPRCGCARQELSHGACQICWLPEAKSLLADCATMETKWDAASARETSDGEFEFVNEDSSEEQNWDTFKEILIEVDSFMGPKQIKATLSNPTKAAKVRNLLERAVSLVPAKFRVKRTDKDTDNMELDSEDEQDEAIDADELADLAHYDVPDHEGLTSESDSESESSARFSSESERPSNRKRERSGPLHDGLAHDILHAHNKYRAQAELDQLTALYCADDVAGAESLLKRLKSHTVLYSFEARKKDMPDVVLPCPVWYTDKASAITQMLALSNQGSDFDYVIVEKKVE